MNPVVLVSSYCNLPVYIAQSLQGVSDRERLSAHSEVLVLQERLGISYKDAAHWLYMDELEKVKMDQKIFKAFASQEASTRKTLEMAVKSISTINEETRD